MSEKNGDLRFGYESALDRIHRINRFLCWIIVLLIVALIGSNVAWIVYESQFSTVETVEENEVKAFQVGDDNSVNGGDIIYGYPNSAGEDN